MINKQENKRNKNKKYEQLVLEVQHQNQGKSRKAENEDVGEAKNMKQTVLNTPAQDEGPQRSTMKTAIHQTHKTVKFRTLGYFQSNQLDFQKKGQTLFFSTEILEATIKKDNNLDILRESGSEAETFEGQSPGILLPSSL